MLRFMGLQRVRHDIHARHQSHKTKHDGADTLALFILAHVQDHADNADQRSKRRRLEQLNKKAVAFQTA